MPKTTVAKKVFTNDAGDESRSAQPDTTGLEIQFTDGGTVSLTVEDFSAEIQRCCAWYGLSQKVGDGYSGAKEKGGADPVAWAREQAEAVIENLTNGIWVTTGTGGVPRITMLITAINEVSVAERGAEPDQDQLRERLKDKAWRESIQENPQVAAVMARLRAEAAAERAKAAADAAEKAAPDEGFLADL